MRLAAEVVLTALVGGFPIVALAGVSLVDRIRYRHEHPEQRALRVLADAERDRRLSS